MIPVKALMNRPPGICYWDWTTEFPLKFQNSYYICMYVGYYGSSGMSKQPGSPGLEAFSSEGLLYVTST